MITDRLIESSNKRFYFYFILSIDLTSLHDFPIRFWNCSVDSVVFIVFHFY